MGFFLIWLKSFTRRQTGADELIFSNLSSHILPVAVALAVARFFTQCELALSRLSIAGARLSPM